MTARRLENGGRLRLHLLVMRCQAGDERAFTRLMEEFGERTLRYLRGLVDDAAEDLQQDLWLAVYRSAHTLADPGAFTTWLFRSARHRAIDHLRRRRLERVLFAETDEVEAIPSPAADDDAAPDVADIASRLDSLAPIHREVLILRFQGGMSYAEIALVAGCSVGTVRSRLHYARQHLHSLLSAGAHPRRSDGADTSRGDQ